ncbi:MAG: fibronectin type III domain-containing protein [Candidatus Cloacimonetes bacterium]|nr:fibronectin type III domain-containing protein [Candidatus Cloacimonadota bacterium]
MKKLLILLGITLLMTLSCSLRRSNPLDPNGDNDITVPLQVTDVTATAQSVPNSSIRSVVVSWTRNSVDNSDGYYIYRSLGYYAEFALVGEVGNIGEFTHLNVLPGQYYYKVSAFKQYSEGRLEGRASSPPTYVHVPN